jgi:hypothetical protein
MNEIHLTLSYFILVYLGFILTYPKSSKFILLHTNSSWIHPKPPTSSWLIILHPKHQTSLWFNLLHSDFIQNILLHRILSYFFLLHPNSFYFILPSYKIIALHPIVDYTRSIWNKITRYILKTETLQFWRVWKHLQWGRQSVGNFIYGTKILNLQQDMRSFFSQKWNY